MVKSFLIALAPFDGRVGAGTYLKTRRAQVGVHTLEDRLSHGFVGHKSARRFFRRAFELWFDENHGRSSGREAVSKLRQDFAQRDKRDINDGQRGSGGVKNHRVEMPEIRSLEHVDPRILTQPVIEQSVAHVHAPDFTRAGLQ